MQPLAARILNRVRRHATPYVRTSLGFSLRVVEPKTTLDAKTLHERELHLVEWARLVNPGDTVFDIGGCYGVASLIVAGTLRGECRIICFETNPYNIGVILDNASANGFQRCILPVNLGIGEGRAVIPGGFAKKLLDYTGMGMVIQNRGELQPTSRPMLICTAGVDDLVAAGMPTPQHIKIDVDGAEAAVMRGARETIARGVRTVCLEWIDSDPMITGEVRWLNSLGFRQIFDRVNAVEKYAPGATPGNHRDTVFSR